MRKQTTLNIKANAAVKAVLSAFYTIGKIYGSALDKLTKQYVELNKDKQINQEYLDKEAYKKTKLKIINPTEEVIAIEKEQLKNAIQTYYITQKPEHNIINNTAEEVLEEKIKNLFQTLKKMEIVLYKSKEEYILENIMLADKQIEKELENNHRKTLNQIEALNHKMQEKRKKNIWNNPVFNKAGFIASCISLTIQIYLSISGTENSKWKAQVNFASSRIEEFFEDELSKVNNYLLEINSIFLEQKGERTDEIYKKEFHKILMQEKMPFEMQLERIIHSRITNYENIFDYCLEEPRIYTKLSITQTIDKLMHSGITSYTNIFDYVLTMNTINTNTKMNLILNSKIASNHEIFQYILTKSGLKQYEAIDYIVHSKVATYEEKIAFIIKNPNFSIEQKEAYALLIPDVPFEKVMNDLLKLEGTTEEQIIKNIINADMVPFKKLFNTLSKQEAISKEKFLEYVIIYNASFNAVTIDEKASYILNLNNYDENVKLDAIWNLLSEYSTGEKFDFIFNFFETDFEKYLNIYNKQTKNLSVKQQRIMYLLDKVLEEMEEYIVDVYDFNSVEELYKVIAVVSGEGTSSFQDYYWVSNVIYNRITNPNYVRDHGTNPYNQIIASNQFSVWESGAWKSFLNPTNIEDKKRKELARLAFDLMFYLKEEGICQSFLEFRWNGTNLYNISIVPNGNRYGKPMSESSRIENENVTEDEIYTLKHTLENLKKL